jgi:hypothetical protein
MTVTATYNGEELNVTFVASIERCDYGVEGSPVWYEVKSDTIEIVHFDILGIDVGPAHLAARTARRNSRAVE